MAYYDFTKAITTFLSLETKSLDAHGQSIYDNYNLITLQSLDADDFEDCEFSSKFRAETIREMGKLMACVGH